MLSTFFLSMFIVCYRFCRSLDCRIRSKNFSLGTVAKYITWSDRMNPIGESTLKLTPEVSFS